MIKALFAKVTGEREVKNLEEPLVNSIIDTLNGYFEIVRPRYKLPNKFVMVVDEEGLLKGLSLHQIGTILYNNLKRTTERFNGQLHPIVGNVLFIREDFTDDGPDFVDATDEDIAVLNQFLDSIMK